jgi:heat shock protein HtpX
VISADVRDPELRSLVETVHQLARSAQLPALPEVGIYDSPEPNAFATGPTKSRALVAVSTGLLRSMNAEQVRGVLGHEVTHIANGDMVTMTLIQGVINAFVMFAARAIAFALTQSRDSEGRREGSQMSYYIVSMLLEVVFMILGSLVVAWFSRQREYRADKGGARLAGRDSMIHALQGLQRTFDVVANDASPTVQTLKISSHGGGLLALFSTHPPLEDRIARLQSYTA